MNPVTDADIAKLKVAYEKKLHRKQFVKAKKNEKFKKMAELHQEQCFKDRLKNNDPLGKFKIPKKLSSRVGSGSSGRIMDVKSTSRSGESSGLAKDSTSRNATVRHRNAFDVDSPRRGYPSTYSKHDKLHPSVHGKMENSSSVMAWIQRNRQQSKPVVLSISSGIPSSIEETKVGSFSEVIPPNVNANLEVIPVNVKANLEVFPENVIANLEVIPGNLDANLENVPMDIDEDVVGGIQELRGQSPHNSDIVVVGPLTQLSNENRLNSNNQKIGDELEPIKIIFLILDTNVLASDLAMIDNLMKTWTGENGSTKLILVVPWVVLQELDKLKDDKQDKKPKLKMLAANAVRYLHGLLTHGHTQIKGQTIQEASADVGWEITCNDDRILQCCFQCKKRGEGEVILFTNDRNLCNKALVNQLQAYTKETIIKEIEKIAPLPEKTKKLQNITWDGKVETGSKFCDEILSQVKSILHDMLANIVKTEMIKQYHEKWTSVISIQPPWRLNDILTCLKKHWLAVFSFIDRNTSNTALTHLDTIRAKFNLDQGTFNKDDLKALLFASVRLMSYFQNTDADYKEDVKTCIHQLRNFLDEVKNIRLATYQKKAGEHSQEQHVVTQEAKIQPEAFIEFPKEDISMTDIEELEMVDEHPCPIDVNQHLKTTLQGIWNFINNTCGLILDSLSIPHSICYQRPKPLLSVNEALSTIPTFFSTVMELAMHVETVLRLEETASPENHAIEKLAAYLDNFFYILGMESDTKVDEIITPDALHKYIMANETRDRLVVGFRQLEDIGTLMNQCILKVESSGMGRATNIKKHI